ncbi:MAG: MBL fold metallo-hydrolase [Blastocatellia bacterium]|nr:MBL fold metallo-hydrolase [Blastocatellia bacterium]
MKKDWLQIRLLRRWLANSAQAVCAPRIFGLLLIALIALGSLSCRPKVEQVNDQPLPDEPAPGGNLRIYALDVGQGDGLLIISPQGKTVLIDAGPTEAGDEVVAALRAHGVKQIDLMVATHPHADHIGGMKKVFDTFRVRKFLDSGQTYGTATYEKLLREIQDNKTPYIKAVRGQSIEIEPDVKFDVYGPPTPLFSNSDIGTDRSVQNANSIVLRLSYGSFAMLFMGDAEFETEARMMTAGANLRANVLKVGHHGSRHATSGKFLTAVAPQFSIISVGENNDYGHPAQLTMDRLKKASIKTLRTDLSGEIEIFSDGKTFDARPSRKATLAQTWAGRQPVRNELTVNP